MSNIETLDNIVSEAMGMVADLKKLMMKADHRCPDCKGTNLNRERTICLDCEKE